MSCSFQSMSLILVIVAAAGSVADRPVWAEPVRAENTAASPPPGTTSIDCTIAAVDYLDDPSLTRAEKLARMDEALNQSLDKFDTCRTVRAQVAAPASAAAGQAAPHGGAAPGGGSTQSVASSEIAGTGAPPAGSESASQDGAIPEGDPVRSVASSEIGGTEAPPVRSEPVWSTPPASPDIPEATAAVGPEQQTLPNGRLPKDIPEADNDSVLAAQIRKAAMQETDPEKRKRLWEEYRRYKDRAAAQEY